MATPNGLNPTLEGVDFTVRNINPDAVSSATASIPPSQKVVQVGTVVNDANDWIVLPPIADVPLGHTVTILANAGGNFEIRTPASSNTTINDQDSDGTKEYLATDTDVIVMTKRTTTGWLGQSVTKLGAERVVVPD